MLPEVLEVVGSEGPTAEPLVGLFDACRNGDLQTVKHLVSLDVDIKGNDNYAVKLASVHGYLEVVKYLVSLGANIRAQYDWSLRWASHNGHLNIVEYLVSIGADINAEHDWAVRHASKNGWLGIVKYLVSVGADINAENDYAVRWASHYEQLEMVEYLLSIGADAMKVDEKHLNIIQQAKKWKEQLSVRLVKDDILDILVVSDLIPIIVGYSRYF